MLGIALAYYFEPGVGMNIDPKTLDAKAIERLHPDGSPGCRRRRLGIPHEAHSLDRGRQRLYDRRHPAGVDRLDHVWLRRLPVRRARQAGGGLHRTRQRHRLQDDGFRRQAGAARRVRGDCIYRRQIWHRLAQATRRPRRPVLRGGGRLSSSSCWAAVMRLVRLQPVQAAPLLARGADDRSRHGGRRQRAAADHAQARTARHQAVDGWPGDSDRILVQSRCVLDLPDAGRRCSLRRPPTRRWRR